VVVGEVGPDQRPEHHAVGGEEDPHQELDVGQAGAAPAEAGHHPAGAGLVGRAVDAGDGGGVSDVRAHAVSPSSSGCTWWPPTPSTAQPKIVKITKNPQMIARTQLSYIRP